MTRLIQHLQTWDPLVGRFNSWATAIGKIVAILAGLALAAAWLLKQIEGVSAVLTALGVTCGVVITGSIALAAWRYFKPLPAYVPATTDAEVIGAIPREWHRSMQVLIHYATDSIALSLLENRIKGAPSFTEIIDADLTPENCAERTKTMESYLAETRKALRHSYRGDPFQAVLDMAANLADHEVREMSPGTRPSGLDPFQYRQYRMTKAQFDRCLSYLKHQQTEALETHYAHMHQLREALRRLEDASLSR